MNTKNVAQNDRRHEPNIGTVGHGSQQTAALQMALHLVGVDPSAPEPDRQAREFAANDLYVLSTLLHLSGQGDLGLDAHYQLCLSQTLKHVSDRLLMADDLLRMLNDASDESGEK